MPRWRDRTSPQLSSLSFCPNPPADVFQKEPRAGLRTRRPPSCGWSPRFCPAENPSSVFDLFRRVLLSNEVLCRGAVSLSPCRL